MKHRLCLRWVTRLLALRYAFSFSNTSEGRFSNLAYEYKPCSDQVPVGKRLCQIAESWASFACRTRLGDTSPCTPFSLYIYSLFFWRWNWRWRGIVTSLWHWCDIGCDISVTFVFVHLLFTIKKISRKFASVFAVRKTAAAEKFNEVQTPGNLRPFQCFPYQTRQNARLFNGFPRVTSCYTLLHQNFLKTRNPPPFSRFKSGYRFVPLCSAKNFVLRAFAFKLYLS